MDRYSEDMITAMTEAIRKMVNQFISKAKYDVTFRAMVIEKKDTDKYEIEYKGKRYILQSKIPLTTGDFVTVCAPQNNLSNLYIQLNANDEWLTKYIKS